MRSPSFIVSAIGKLSLFNMRLSIMSIFVILQTCHLSSSRKWIRALLPYWSLKLTCRLMYFSQNNIWTQEHYSFRWWHTKLCNNKLCLTLYWCILALIHQSGHRSGILTKSLTLSIIKIPCRICTEQNMNMCKF